MRFCWKYRSWNCIQAMSLPFHQRCSGVDRMKLPDNIAHRILNHAKRANLNGPPPSVTSLCKGYGLPMSSWLRKTVAKLLDAEGVPRRRSPRRTVKESLSVGAEDFGQKFESLSRVFVDINKTPIRDTILADSHSHDISFSTNRDTQSPCDDIDTYLVARAKAGSVRAFEILKKVVG